MRKNVYKNSLPPRSNYKTQAALHTYFPIFIACFLVQQRCQPAWPAAAAAFIDAYHSGVVKAQQQQCKLNFSRETEAKIKSKILKKICF